MPPRLVDMLRVDMRVVRIAVSGAFKCRGVDATEYAPVDGARQRGLVAGSATE